jgi:ketosteroid isomerase-like protein
MTIQEIANTFTDLCKAGRFDEAGEQFWADCVVSLEAAEGDMARVEGLEGVQAKGAWWYANHEIHSVEVEGPYVHGNQLIVRFTMEVTPKGGERMSMDEMGVYTVQDGKVVEERFFYGS